MKDPARRRARLTLKAQDRYDNPVLSMIKDLRLDNKQSITDLLLECQSGHVSCRRVADELMRVHRNALRADRRKRKPEIVYYSDNGPLK